MPSERRVRVEPVAWLTGLIPLVTVNLCYLITAAQTQVPWCFPYGEGCTSISAAARHEPAGHLFKAVLLPYSGLLMFHWWLTAEWLRGFAPAQPRRRRAMVGLAVTGALFLILYATFLGVDGPTYQWLRRYGVSVYFSFTVLAQILLTSFLVKDPRLPARLRYGKLSVCAALLLLGLLSVPLQHFVADRDAALNAVEWSYALLMVSFFPLTGWAWRHTGFHLGIHVAIPSRTDRKTR
ncbi:MAG: hypothetical protein L0Y32_04505 [Nevskiales bacterium]|nr:hypothetical protein [Nevskiales bacterium]